MDQEARSSDILTVLANLMDSSQVHGMQSSQNNNNNSNPTRDVIGVNTTLTENSQIEAVTTQVMNAHLLNMAGQVTSAAVSGSNGSASDAEIAEIERLSVLMNPNFSNATAGTAGHNTQDALYEAASQIGMAATEVGSALPPYSSHPIDFTGSQNQAILEAFNTIDTSTAASLSCAQSYVSLLQQQSVDLWSGQGQGSNTGNFNTVHNTGGSKQNMGNTRAHTHGSTAQTSSNLDKTTSHLIHASSTKSAMLMQHSPRMGSVNKAAHASQQYNHNPSNMTMQYSSGRSNSKNRNDLVITTNDGMQLPDEVMDSRGKEKKLTTTPIPSDADKSSCSSTSSGSISGPEHSPDHVTDRSSASSIGRVHNMDDNVLLGATTPQKDREGRSKNYPCYGNMKLVNFGTINFTPVMDSAHNGMGSGDVQRNIQEGGGGPLPTSDSIIEIGESVTSPMENIPMSPTTPTAVDQGFGGEIQKMKVAPHGSYAQMQTVSGLQQTSHSQSGSRKLGKSRTMELPRSNLGHKLVDSNNNNSSPKIPQVYNKNFASLSTVTPDKLQEKRKTYRGSKHHPSTQRHDGNLYGGDVRQFNFSNVTETAQGSQLKPKVNADPTIRLKQNYSNQMQNLNRQPSQGTSMYSTNYGTKHLAVTYPIANPNKQGNQKSGQPRQWQTVTAVQSPKLPPMLSEQDRIPKRGRPSKKMMQQNLKVNTKSDASANTGTISSTPAASNQIVSPVQGPSQPPVTSSKLVSTYTINENGLMEEISPKPKENKRSKERSEAFYKYLDEIKISSKNQQHQYPKPEPERQKSVGEKQKKKSSRPRSKVFGGRQSSQVLTESGITQTMYTFSALAQQYKISHSILERATENLLKSAASKKSKEQQQLQHSSSNENRQVQTQRSQTDKTTDKTQSGRVIENNMDNKGVSNVTSHCETNLSGSKVHIRPTSKLHDGSMLSDQRNMVPRPQQTSTTITVDSLSPEKTDLFSNTVSTTIGPKTSAVTHKNRVIDAPKTLPHTDTMDFNPETTLLPENDQNDDDEPSLKGKHKKKKHKKHKKHKYPDSGSGKKKKKDKERKKKLKKKMKAKATPSIIPSTSVSLLKPASKSSLVGSDDDSAGVSMQKRSDNFSTSFRQTESVDIENSWQQDDTTYDAEDSSSDENSTSPKSVGDVNSEPFSTSVSTATLSSFAQYNEERIGFGTFSMPIPKSPPIQTQNAITISASSSAKEVSDTRFGSQSLVRLTKKHSKHKKSNKKLLRKSKTCDPAFLAILDSLLVSLKDMKLDRTALSSKQLNISQPSTNIFLSTSVADTISTSLWRPQPGSLSSRKSNSYKSTVKSTSALFPNDSHISGLKEKKTSSEFQLRKSKRAVHLSESGDAVDSTSVFCRSPFFQKYGYVIQAEKSAITDKKQVGKRMKEAPGKRDTKSVTDSARHTTDNSNVNKGRAKLFRDVQRDTQADSITQKKSPSEPVGKKKRGWPRGKPRGPRVKRGKFMGLSRSDVATDNKATESVLTQIESEKRPKTKSTDKKKPVSSADNQSIVTLEASGNPQSSLQSNLSSIVDTSLLQQHIKQAIEASLPKDQSVNKDALAKSVDAAVQSYLKNIKNSTEGSNAKDDSKKKPERRRSRTTSREGTSKLSGEVSPKSDIHPKKLWACKHQDTESSTSKQQATDLLVPPLMKKRGPGRPRKNPISESAVPKRLGPKLSQTGTKHGKVPTASATVVPTRRKVLTVRIQGKCVKPAVKRLLARAKNDAAKRVESAPAKPTKVISTTITKDAALSCLSALCSMKAAKVLAKSGDRESISDGLYTGTEIDDHINETLDTTISMYSWNNYKKFEEACLAVEAAMGLYDDSDPMEQNKPKSPGVKKSIESVVAKLKNKQAQNLHSAATALLELHNVSSSKDLSDCDNVMVIDNRTADSIEGCRMAGRQQDIYEKVSSYKKDSNQSSKLHKVKSSRLTAVGSKSNVPLKRPRGRPKKTVDDYAPPKKRLKTNSESSLHSEASSKGVLPYYDSSNKKSKARQMGKMSSSTSGANGMDPTLSPRKPYLDAGLYSSTFKKDTKSSKVGSQCSEENILKIRAKLPPPFDAGLYLRSTGKDFQLPYDIWWMYKCEKISPSQDPSINFVKINKNVYVGSRPTVSQTGEHVCSCDPQEDENCGKQCLNRLMYIECQPSSCPCGLSCSNQVIQKGQWCKSIERFKTSNRGWGIRTMEAISEGAFVLEYVGEVVSESEFRMRTIELYHAYNNHYCVQLDTSYVIDGYRMANEGRFVNHSCEPNCEMQKWCIDGEQRIGLFALREIQPNEELTYDYNFHAYNINTQQACRCGFQKCRGFIGGRAQRFSSMDSDTSSVSSVVQQQQTSTKLHGKRSKFKAFKNKDEETTVKDFSILQMKPIPKRERDFVRSSQLFLLRNLSQVRRKEEGQRKKSDKKSGDGTSYKSNHKSKPKKGHQSKEEKEKLEAAITEMYTAIATCKDQNGVSVAIPFMNLPSKKKNPEYYERISDPIDLSIIERNIVSKHYKDVETFNNDVQRVFKNAEKYHGKKSTLGKDVFRLRRAYANARGAAMLILNGHKKAAQSSEVSDEDLDEADENIHRKNEDHIRCICCIYKDEGVMVQCEKCYVWQHCDCMGVDPESMDRYLCEECDPRPCPREVKVIPSPPNTPPGHTFYLTLLRDELLVKQGDCAYLMRGHRLRHGSNAPAIRASHRNLAHIPQDKLDIFRIDQLWTDESGDKYACGYHFLRPHETHHAPSRTFYHNELFASPFYEIIPLEAVVDLCCVMDLYTYCKGKPKDFKMSDIYICDFRIDKAASSFNRITKKRYPICTKPHVFDTYRRKLCPKKDFQPHQVPEQYRKSAGRPRIGSNTSDQDALELDSHADSNSRMSEDGDDWQYQSLLLDKSEVGTKAWRKRQRLDGIAHKLLSKLPKQAVDVSYLLEPGNGKRSRKKTQLSLESLGQQK